METGFFKVIWRFNAIAIALVAVAALIVSAVILAELVFSNAPYTMNVVNVDERDQSLVETLDYGAPFRTVDAKTFVVPIRAAQTYDHSYGSSKKTKHNTVNYMVRDGDVRFHTLFADNSQLILDKQLLAQPKSASDDQLSKAHAYLLEVIGTDTSGDERLSESDLSTLMLVDLEFQNPHILFEDVEWSDTPTFVRDTYFEINVKTDGRLKNYLFDAISGALLEEVTLPPLQ